MSDKSKKKTGQKEKQMREDIIKLLKENGKMSTNKIAESLGVATATASKYLGFLKVEGVVERNEDQLPYVYWSWKDDNGEQTD